VGRLGLAAVLSVAGAATVGLGLLGRELIREPYAAYPQPIVADPGHARDPRGRWTVTEKRSAHYVLIFQVETQDLGDALAIASDVAGPFTSRYTEILIYFHRPGRPDILPPRRVQWTAANGYVETIYDDSR
jgi:hypothetical protein